VAVATQWLSDTKKPALKCLVAFGTFIAYLLAL
jgi:hypothetical protein